MHVSSFGPSTRHRDCRAFGHVLSYVYFQVMLICAARVRSHAVGIRGLSSPERSSDHPFECCVQALRLRCSQSGIWGKQPALSCTNLSGISIQNLGVHAKLFGDPLCRCAKLRRPSAPRALLGAMTCSLGCSSFETHHRQAERSLYIHMKIAENALWPEIVAMSHVSRCLPDRAQRWSTPRPWRARHAGTWTLQAPSMMSTQQVQRVPGVVVTAAERTAGRAADVAPGNSRSSRIERASRVPYRNMHRRPSPDCEAEHRCLRMP